MQQPPFLKAVHKEDTYYYEMERQNALLKGYDDVLSTIRIYDTCCCMYVRILRPFYHLCSSSHTFTGETRGSRINLTP